jgi:hypothetical protein
MRFPLPHLFCLVLSNLLLSSCIKKSEDDPFLSFHSRKARVVGEWKAVDYLYKATYIDSLGGDYEYTFHGTGTDYDLQYTKPGAAYSGSGDDFRMKWTFAKDGTYTETISADGYDDSFNGTWNFNGGIGDQKAKTKISLFEQTANYGGSSGGIYGHAGNYIHDTYDILELRNKKMHLNTVVTQTWETGEIRSHTYEYDIILEQEGAKEKK